MNERKRKKAQFLLCLKTRAFQVVASNNASFYFEQKTISFLKLEISCGDCQLLTITICQLFASGFCREFFNSTSSPRPSTISMGDKSWPTSSRAIFAFKMVTRRVVAIFHTTTENKVEQGLTETFYSCNNREVLRADQMGDENEARETTALHVLCRGR